jgi:hypothetical protein
MAIQHKGHEHPSGCCHNTDNSQLLANFIPNPLLDHPSHQAQAQHTQLQHHVQYSDAAPQRAGCM